MAEKERAQAEGIQIVPLALRISQYWRRICGTTTNGVNATEIIVRAPYATFTRNAIASGSPDRTQLSANIPENWVRLTSRKTSSSKKIEISARRNDHDLDILFGEAAVEIVLQFIERTAVGKKREADDAERMNEWDIDLLGLGGGREAMRMAEERKYRRHAVTPAMSPKATT